MNEGDMYFHATSTRTHWKIRDLYAVPVDTLDPASWEYSASFHTQLTQTLRDGEGPEAFARACTEIWTVFFSDTADVLVTLERTITRNDEPLQCVSGVWTVVASQVVNQTDTTDWLRLNPEPLAVSDSNSIQVLQGLLQRLLDNLNTQPGAHSDVQ